MATQTQIRTVGILGAGKLGTTLGRHLVAAGHRVLMSGSGDPGELELTLPFLVPGAEARWSADLVAELDPQTDAVVLALPLTRLPLLHPTTFDGLLTLDAINHWEPVDGPLPHWHAGPGSSSERVARRLPGARVVKVFSHLGYHDLDLLARPDRPERNDRDEVGERVAIGVAADDAGDAALVAGLVRGAGFAPVVLPTLAAGAALEAGSPVFGATLTAPQLKALVLT